MSTLDLYSDPIAARRAPHCKGGVLQLHVNQATRYFWPFLPLIDTDGINLPSFEKKKELFYQVTPDLPDGLSLESKTGIVRVDGGKLITQETIDYTFTVLYEFNVIYNVIGIKIDLCPPSECLELTVNQRDDIYALPFVVSTPSTPSTPSTVLPEGITLLPSLDKLAICGAKLHPQASTEYTFESKSGIKYVLCITVNRVPYFVNQCCDDDHIKKRLTVGKKVYIDLPVIKGGSKPFLYEANPCLPVGLQFDSCTGSIVGTLLRDDTTTATYVIKARDSNGVYTSNNVTLDLIIKPNLCSETECDDCLLFTVNQKDTFFCPIDDVRGGYEPYTYSVCPALPHGFRLNSATGRVTVLGCDLKPMGITEFIFKVCDDDGTYFCKTICLTVNTRACVDACSCSDIVLTENQKDTRLIVLKTVGGTDPLVYSVHPKLPTGIELNRLTGQLHVTGSELVATEKTIAYSFTVLDKCLVEVVAHEILKIRVTCPPVAYCHFSCPPAFKHTTRLLKPKSKPNSNSKPKPKPKCTCDTTDISLTVNKPTEFTVLNVSKGGACPLTYYISQGCLPDFLTLDPDSGVLCGTPTESKMEFTFTLAVKDKNDVSATYECAVTIVIQCQACFPGNALATLENGQTVALTELKIGDKIYTGVDRISEVYLFTHALPLAETPFIELTTENEHIIVLSAGHYLYVNGFLVKAETVKLNDILRTDIGESCVIKMEYVRETGLYNPHTLDGDIMINGVCTSTYTDALRPDLAHGILAPMRYLYALR